MIRELIGYAGLSMVIWGTALYSRPAALILGGALAIVIALFGLPERKKSEG